MDEFDWWLIFEMRSSSCSFQSRIAQNAGDFTEQPEILVFFFIQLK